ncbi:hypothetical protein QR685DRAFT_536102, partial [Neurospora intermedia]
IHPSIHPSSGRCSSRFRSPSLPTSRPLPLRRTRQANSRTTKRKRQRSVQLFGLAGQESVL